MAPAPLPRALLPAPRRSPSTALLWIDASHRDGEAVLSAYATLRGIPILRHTERTQAPTSNIAEFQAAAAGLRALRRTGYAGRVEVRTDSLGLVLTLLGQRSPRPGPISSALEAIGALCSAFTAVRWRWVPRARNRHAHRLCENHRHAPAPPEHAATRMAAV
jgi:ribonuclease HI